MRPHPSLPPCFRQKWAPAPLLLPGPQGSLDFPPDWPFLWAGRWAGGERGTCPVLSQRPVGALTHGAAAPSTTPFSPETGRGAGHDSCELGLRSGQGRAMRRRPLPFPAPTPLPESPTEQPLRGPVSTRLQLALPRSALPSPPAAASGFSDKSFLVAYPARQPSDGASRAPLPKPCLESLEERDASPPDVPRSSSPPRSMGRARPHPSRPECKQGPGRGSSPPLLIGRPTVPWRSSSDSEQRCVLKRPTWEARTQASPAPSGRSPLPGQGEGRQRDLPLSAGALAHRPTPPPGPAGAATGAFSVGKRFGQRKGDAAPEMRDERTVPAARTKEGRRRLGSARAPAQPPFSFHEPACLEAVAAE